MTPSEIIDARGELLERLQFNGYFQKHQAIMAQASIAKSKVPDSDPDVVNMQQTSEGDAWVSGLTNFVRASHAFRVTGDMCAVLEHAAASLDESDVFDRDNAPTGCGIVHFDRPIQVADIRGRTMLVDWAIWGPGEHFREPALAFTYFNDIWRQADDGWLAFLEEVRESQGQEMVDQVLHNLGRWSTVHFDMKATGEPLGPSELEASPGQQARVVASGKVPRPATNLSRYMHALFLLLNQTLVQTEDEFGNRPSRRRAEKMGLPPKVTVIKLRRTEGVNRAEGESMVEWSHRWIVRGHWAWRRCSADKPLAQPYEKGWRIRVWIAPFQKGPEDAPLIVSDKVYSLDR